MEQSFITEEDKKAARYAKALGHPVRIFIIRHLSEQACCYSGDLTDILPIAKSTLSQHLKELKNAGLIQGEIELPRIRYCLNNEKFNEAKKLLKNILQ
jgi:ArsR family transcriptional regulator, arsenate/arsenite/antimonite-responsive transcriptional repressor